MESARALAALERRLARLEDIDAIKRVQTQYGCFVDDAYNLEGLESLFVEDAVWESNAFGTYSSRQAYLEGQKKIAQGVKWGFHVFACNGVDVASDGKTATGCWYLILFGTFLEKDGKTAVPIMITARYDNTLVKVGGQWKFKRMKVNFHQVSDVNKGWVAQPFWNA